MGKPTEEQRKTLRNATYLKRNGWLLKELPDVDWGWIDPKTEEHYFEKDALHIQLIRDASKNKRFAKEPAYHD